MNDTSKAADHPTIKLVQRLREDFEFESSSRARMASKAADLIEQQAARIAELEAAATVPSSRRALTSGVRSHLKDAVAVLNKYHPSLGSTARVLEELLVANPRLDSSAPASGRRDEAASVPHIPTCLLDQLRRFNECCGDHEADGHDVEKKDMRSLAELGAVRPAPGGRHYMTEFGHYLLASARSSTADDGRLAS